MHKSIWIYPWDLKDEGIDYVMDTVSKTGLNAISVAASYHAGKFLRPHSPKGKVYFPEDGVIYFRPDLSLYENTRIKPCVSSLTSETNLFEDISIKAKHHGLNLVAWTVCLHNSRIGKEYPDFTVKNAFGDSYRHSICCNNRDVREYIKSLIKDISSNYDLYAIELESPGFMPFEHGFHHEMYGVNLNFLQSFLLSLCFCKNCIRLAEEEGINVDEVKKRAKDNLNTSFSLDVLRGSTSGEAEFHEFISLLLESEEFYRYLVFRNYSIVNFIKEIKAVLPAKVKLFVISSISKPCSSSWIEGINIRNIASIVDAVEILSYFKSPRDIRSDLWFAKITVGTKSRLNIGLRPCFPDTPDVDNLIRKIEVINKIGVDGVSFYNYGHMPRENLNWIKKSLDILEEKQ